MHTSNYKSKELPLSWLLELCTVPVTCSASVSLIIGFTLSVLPHGDSTIIGSGSRGGLNDITFSIERLGVLDFVPSIKHRAALGVSCDFL